MSDDFIPFNQSTPIQTKGQNRNHNDRGYQNNWNRNGQGRIGFNNRWSNYSQRNNSFGSDSNSSYGKDGKNDIDAYLHPSMLQDPWAHLRKNDK